VQARRVATNGIELSVLEAGAGRPVILLHGFPELGWSWRHQIPALAAAGHRVLAPDLRGFGDSSAPEGPEGYDLLTLARDVLGLADAHGIGPFTVIGHDWGAALAWILALVHPERITAVAGLSVPALPRAPAPPIGLLRRHLGEDFYMVWFQEPGVAEAALERDVRRTLRAREVWSAAWAAGEDSPPRPRFWTAEDERRYVETFERTGFTGGLNWYRAFDRTWELLEPYAGRSIDQPALFLTGSRDPVRRSAPAEAMHGYVTDVEVVVVEGAGHWVQQERPEEVNAALSSFLARTAPR
jgi:pimeloyl-ACP methyl ester carboxylesterase